MIKYFQIIIYIIIIFLLLNLTNDLKKSIQLQQHINKQQKTEIFTDNQIANTHNISLLEIPYGNYYQIIIPSNDGLSAFNVFVTFSDLYELREIINIIEKKETKR